MTDAQEPSPALAAAREADARVIKALKEGTSFLLEAGAGAGKTYSLVEALRHLIATEGGRMRRNNQRIACITYTNAATAVIDSRIDGNPLVFTGTIHAFCWSLIKGFQPSLRRVMADLEGWHERIEDAGGVGLRRINYDLGYRRIADDVVSIHHDDVLQLMVALLGLEKFQAILSNKYPFILIDEYQDTDSRVMAAFEAHVLGRRGSSLIGLFGDHWQRIYDNTCGRVAHGALLEIGKGANFRSATSIVKVLNAMRPELPQGFKDETFAGEARAYHTNAWVGMRRSGDHWKGDLEPNAAHHALESLVARLKTEGWDFAPEKTKILMLTHSILAAEQGYPNLRRVFQYSDAYIKKQDEFIAFLADKIEPACDAYKRKRYGEMFGVLGDVAPKFASHAEKVEWAAAMDGLISRRDSGTIGEVVDYIRDSRRLRLPDSILGREKQASEWVPAAGEAAPDTVRSRHELRAVAYSELIALTRFIGGSTPFATKHSVKGDQFENVLVVVGRGWSQYNFGQYLASAASPPDAQSADWQEYERNRNLLYVACSRPTTRLALLFTQLLPDAALHTLRSWFGAHAVEGFNA